MRRFGLISDTHGRFHPDIPKHFAGVEAILHAGDVCGDDVLDGLEEIARTWAVCGNCDMASQRLPSRRIVELPFGIAGIAHGHEHPHAIEERVVALVKTFQRPRLRLVLTGHSHEALHRVVGDVHVVNPGAASPPRLGKDSSLVVMEWNEERDAFTFDFRTLRW